MTVDFRNITKPDVYDRGQQRVAIPFHFHNPTLVKVLSNFMNMLDLALT